MTVLSLDCNRLLIKNKQEITLTNYSLRNIVLGLKMKERSKRRSKIVNPNGLLTRHGRRHFYRDFPWRNDKESPVDKNEFSLGNLLANLN